MLGFSQLLGDGRGAYEFDGRVFTSEAQRSACAEVWAQAFLGPFIEEFFYVQDLCTWGQLTGRIDTPTPGTWGYERFQEEVASFLERHPGAGRPPAPEHLRGS